MEFLLEVANEDQNNIIKECNIFDEYLPIQFQLTPQSTSMYFALSPQQAEVLEKKKVTYNWHM